MREIGGKREEVEGGRAGRESAVTTEAQRDVKSFNASRQVEATTSKPSFRRNKRIKGKSKYLLERWGCWR